ncbi:MAG: helix-turn-helix domain-containing protein [Thermoplasmata archaeon]
MERYSDLLQAVRLVMKKAGFCINSEADTDAIAFDIIGRRDNLLLIIRVLVALEALRKNNAVELLVLGKILNASPLIVCERNQKGPLPEGVIFTRNAVPVISFKTFSEYLLEGVPPAVFASSGGYYVKIDSNLMRERRTALGYSYGAVAEAAGVSRKAVQMYEEGMCPTLEIALKLEEFLNTDLILEIDPFNYDVGAAETSLDDSPKLEDFEKDIFSHVKKIGFDNTFVPRCPFRAVSTPSPYPYSKQSEGPQERYVSREAGPHKKSFRANQNISIISRAVPLLSTSLNTPLLMDISVIANKQAVIFSYSEHAKPSLETLPVITKKELEDADDAETLLQLIEKRKKEIKKD